MKKYKSHFLTQLTFEPFDHVCLLRGLDVQHTMETVVLVGEGPSATEAEEELLVTTVHHMLSVESDRTPPYPDLESPHQGGNLVLRERDAQQTQLLQLGQIFYEAFEEYWFLKLYVV